MDRANRAAKQKGRADACNVLSSVAWQDNASIVGAIAAHGLPIGYPQMLLI